jgi:hypothetical protein
VVGSNVSFTRPVANQTSVEKAPQGQPFQDQISLGSALDTTSQIPGALQVQAQVSAPVLKPDVASGAAGTQSQAETPTPEQSAPSTLVDLQEAVAQNSTDGVGFLFTMNQALSAKDASEVHWSSALEAFSSLPHEDKVAAGQRAFYTQAAMLPEYAEAVAELPVEQQSQFPTMLIQAKEAGILDVPELEAKVKSWAEANPEQAYMAQMSGFADYAGQQLAAEAGRQGQGSLHQAQGDREQTLQGLSEHAHGYVTDRADYLGGVHSLVMSGHTQLAQQLLDLA